MTKYFDYIKSCYDLVVESEGKCNVILQHDVEAYVVHVLANNFERNDLGVKIIAIELLDAMQTNNKSKYRSIGDECLLIHSMPMKKQKWPTPTYYRDMGMIAYGYINHIMEENFVPASKVLTQVFNSNEFLI